MNPTTTSTLNTNIVESMTANITNTNESRPNPVTPRRYIFKQSTSTMFRKTKKGTFGRALTRKLDDKAVARACKKAGIPNPFPLEKPTGLAAI